MSEEVLLLQEISGKLSGIAWLIIFFMVVFAAGLLLAISELKED